MENATKACKESKPEAMHIWLDQAVQLAEELSYL
jgi:hypothetical protein